MNIYNTLSILLASILLVGCNTKSFESPNHSLRAEIDGQTLSVYYKDSLVFPNIHMGVITEDQNLDSALVLSKTSSKKIAESYRMKIGKKTECSYECNERELVYTNPNGEKLTVLVRLHNDGLAIRYITPEGAKTTKDCTSYGIADGVNRWIATYDSGYEQPFPYATTGEPGQNRRMHQSKNGEWGYPALIEPKSGVFALISEADLRCGDAGSYLNNSKDKEQYEVTLVGPAAFHKGQSPWRCAIIGSLADVVESTLITDLATPNKLEDDSWIKPGVSSWIYWAYNHGSKDYQICKEYIDLAAEMGWPYCLIDWEWPEMTNGGTIDDIMGYANEKGIGISLWYNSGTSWVGPGAPQPQDCLNSAENREKELQKLECMGVKGIKVDFFSPANDEMVKYYIAILKDAARHHLLVDFHGCTIPNGWQRTWPNMMSMEGIYGAEWYNNGPFFTPAAACHNATVPFTRNVIGPMDYTPGSFTDSQFPHITTNTHELALPVLFESGLQHMADRPAGYDSIPGDAREMLSKLPAVWEETKLLSGYPGKEVVMARRSGETWYIAGINGIDEATTLTFSTEKLGLSGKNVQLFCDGEKDREIVVKETEIGQQETSVPCRARGGFVIVVR